MKDLSELSVGAASSSSANVGIKDLFDYCRLLDKNNTLKIILYFPIGLLLVVIRLIACIVGISLLSLLPRTSTWSCIFKGLCKVLGLVIKVDDKFLDDNAKILVANHVSILDRLAVNVVKPCNTFSKSFRSKNANMLSFWKDSDLQYHTEMTENELLAFQSSVGNSSLPVLYFPEEATTNGKVGILKFHPTAFSLNCIIQPVIIQLSLTSFISVSPTVLGSNAFTDTFWPFFVPLICYNLKVLPSMAKLPDEPPLEFSKRVQQTMAKSVDLIPTMYTSTDKFELIKLLKTSSSRIDSSSSSSKESLSGSDQFSQILMKSRELALKEKPTFNTSAKSFGKSPKERMLSYQERKAKLIQDARIKYLQKHNIL